MMIDYLEDLGINDEVLNELEDSLSDDELYSLHGNESNVEKIISYFRMIGVNCIDQLLINYIDIFLTDYDVIYNLFNRYDIEKLVELLNRNYNVITEIWKLE